MPETTTLERLADRETKLFGMVHLYWLGNPHRALCGARLNGSAEADVECIVCVDIAKGMGYNI